MRNYNDSENCYNKKAQNNAQNNVQNQAQNSYSNRTTDSYSNRTTDSYNSYENRARNSQNCRNTKEENCVTDCHRDKDTSGKDSEDEWKNASNSRNAANPIRHETQPIIARDSKQGAVSRSVVSEYSSEGYL